MQAFQISSVGGVDIVEAKGREVRVGSSMSATYSPEDNKLRLYSLSRLSADLCERVKNAGFAWAPNST